MTDPLAGPADPLAGPADPLAADLARLVGEARATDAARARSGERMLRQQATAQATLTGLLLDLAEEGADVTIRTTSGRTHHGRIVTLGRDFAVVATTAGEACLACGALATVRRRPGERTPDATGDRPGPRDVSLAAYLAGLAPDRPRVTIVVAGEPGPLAGELRSVGRDVATVRLDGNPPVTAYVALCSLTEVLVSG